MSVTKSVLVRRNAECVSADFWLGNFGAGSSGLQECEQACATHSACRYFVFGHGSKAGSCFHEVTANSECKEGYETDEYDFYELLRWQPLDGIRSGEAIKRLRSRVECLSGDAELGFFPGRVDECAAACARAPACTFFIFGRGPKDGRCYHEYTSSSRCDEGFEPDEFDFYELIKPDGHRLDRGGGQGSDFSSGFAWGAGAVVACVATVGFFVWRRSMGRPFSLGVNEQHQSHIVPVQALL